MPLLLGIDSSVEEPWLVVGLYGLGYGLLSGVLLIHLQVMELFPTEIRNAGVGVSPSMQ